MNKKELAKNLGLNYLDIDDFIGSINIIDNFSHAFYYDNFLKKRSFLLNQMYWFFLPDIEKICIKYRLMQFFSIKSVRLYSSQKKVISSKFENIVGRFYLIISEIISKSLQHKFGLFLSPYCKISEGFWWGEYTSIGTTAGSTIGKDVRLGSGVNLVPTKNKLGPTIEDLCTIWTGAIIVGGVIVEKGAIVGGNSLVISNVLRDTTAIGVPAKIVGKRKGKDVVQNKSMM